MENRNISRIMFKQYVSRLFKLSKQLNLYVHTDCVEHEPNKKKIKSDIRMIAGLIDGIEEELENI